jgi:hypothetical protein
MSETTFDIRQALIDDIKAGRQPGESRGLWERRVDAFVRALERRAVGDHHPAHADQLMARALGVCWHSPTADRWPCWPESAR